MTTDELKRAHDQLHLEDHKSLASMLDSTTKVFTLEKEVLLMKEKISEMKEDKEKAETKNSKYLNWVFILCMALGGSGIKSYSEVSVLKEQVMEQKKEIEKLHQYASDIENLLHNHEH